MSAKDTYRQWAATAALPLFHRPQWLDVVADNWDVALIEKGDEVTATLPYCVKKGLPGTRIYMPLLTPYLGPVITYPEGQKYAKKLSYEKQQMLALIKALPRFDGFEQRFLPGLDNWLPFYWQGFEQTTRYTYLITETSDVEAVFVDFRDNVRRQIRKAEKDLTVSTGMIDDLYHLKVATYEEREQKNPLTREYVRRIYKLVETESWGTILEARDTEHNLHASIMLVWDDETCYYLLGAADPNFSNSGAMSLLLWEGIKLASEKSLQFNFEGSMVPEIERFFCAFGGRLTPYHQVTKTSSGLLKLRDALR